MNLFSIDLKEIYPGQLAEAPKTELKCFLHETSKELPLNARPAVIVYPGGGYSFLSDRESEIVALQYLAKGYNAFILNYALNNYSYPVQLLQSGAAIKYIKSKAAELHTDAAKIAVCGFSAGGHCAAMITTMSDEKILLDAFGAEKGELRPAAAILCYPVISKKFMHKGSFEVISGGDEKLMEYLSLEERVTSDTPPCFLWHTMSDGGVDVRNSLLFMTKMKECGVSGDLHVFAEGPHGLSLANENTASDDNLEKFSGSPAEKWFELSVLFLKRNGFNVTVKKG